MSLRRMVPFILINIVVSAAVFLLLLYWWDSRGVVDTTLTPTSQAAQSVETPALVDFATPDLLLGTEDEPGETVDEEEVDETGPTTHIVQAGETLGVISQQYDVAVEDIAAANNIVNVNAISVGQELVIPIGGLPTATPEPTALPTAAPTPTGTPSPEVEEDEPRVEISEVIGVGQFTEEAVRITNTGTRPLSLRDWELSDESGNIFTFAGVTLFGRSDAGAPSILVHTEAGENGPSDLFWGLESAVWESGETATLRDAEGVPQATLEIP